MRSLAIRSYLRLAHPGVRCHRTVRFGRGVTVRAFAGGTIELGENVHILDYAWVQCDGGRMVIGKDCLIGRGSVIFCVDAIEIAEGTLTAEHVTIRDQDHRHDGDQRLEAQGTDSAPIRIGRDVWIGAKVTVTRGVTISDRAVVGANSVVTRSLPDRGVYVGAPARLIAKRPQP